MNEKIDSFINKWDEIINGYAKTNNFRSSLDEDLFFQGEFYSPASPDHQLIDDALPEPYLGDPYNSGYVCLNLNPGKYIEALQHPIKGKFNQEGNALDSFRAFAMEFPYLTEKYKSPNVSSKDNGGHKWWKQRHSYYKRLLNNSSISNPFALEICPWRSSRFGSLRRTESFFKYFTTNILDIASIAAINSENSTVFSIGSIYHYMFQELSNSTRFNQIKYISSQDQQGFSFPKRKDGKTVQRHLSLWKDEEYKIYYFNTYAPGSNKPASQEFDDIIRTILKNTASKM